MSNSVFLKPDENGNWGKVGTDAVGNMSELLTFQSGATALGNGTAVDVSGYATLFVQVTISATATVQFEGSLDGTTYTQLGSNAQNGTGTSQTSTTATGLFRFNVAGLKFFRARISSYTSGTVDVIGYASTATFTAQYLTQTYGNNDTNGISGQLLGVGAYNLLFDGTNWARQRSATGAGDGNSSNGLPTTTLMAFNGTNWDRVRSVNTGQLKTTLYNSTGNEVLITSYGNTDGNVATAQTMITSAYNQGFNGSTFDRVRVGKVYKYIEYLNLANATATTVWTPAAGKKFRLMGVMIGLGATNGLVHLRDGAGGSAFFTARDAAAASIQFSFGNGYLSSTANNVLEIYNATGSTINAWVTAWGTEE